MKKYKDVFGEYLGTCERSMENKNMLEQMKSEYENSDIIVGKFPPPHSKKFIFTYMMFDGTYYKLGQSSNVKKRFLSLRVANPNIKIVCFGRGITEKNIHNEYETKCIKGEWYDLNINDVLDAIFKITGKRISKEAAINESFLNLNKKNRRVVLRFGKYNGCDIYQMKSGEELRYLGWLSEQDWLSEYYQDAIINHFDNLKCQCEDDIINPN
jgi:hypothetical protein